MWTILCTCVVSRYLRYTVRPAENAADLRTWPPRSIRVVDMQHDWKVLPARRWLPVAARWEPLPAGSSEQLATSEPAPAQHHDPEAHHNSVYNEDCDGDVEEFAGRSTSLHAFQKLVQRGKPTCACTLAVVIPMAFFIPLSVVSGMVGARERESPACGDPYPIWQKAISMCMAVGVGRQRSRRPTMLQYFW